MSSTLIYLIEDDPDIARLITSKYGCRISSTVKHVTGCQKYRFTVFTVLCSHMTCANCQRIQM